MTYRLLGLTIDGALLKGNGRMSRETRDAIDFVREKGVYVTLISDRNHHAARKVAKLLKMEHEMITYGGAFVAGHVDKPVYEKRLTVDMTYDLVERLENWPCQIQVEHEQFELSNRYQQTKNLLGKMTVSLSESLFQPKTYIDHLADHILDHQISPLRVTASFENERDANRCLQDIQNDIPDIDVRLSGTEMLVKREGADKETALSFLTQELRIMPEEIVMIGADDSDRAAVQMAGLGVAMGQSPASLKNSADWVTRSNEQNGLAYMVKEVFRKQMKVNL